MSASSPPPELTVLITAHNEARHIRACLRAVTDQDYPMERAEILLVDDRSGDGTADVARRMELDGLRIVRLDEADVPLNQTSRQAALDLGMREARGEVVLITDADARPPREWVREMSEHLAWRDGAVTAPEIYAGRFNLMARLQTLFSLITFTFYRWGQRHKTFYGLVEANLAIRRNAYLETGGFSAIGFAPSEGFQLGRALVRAGWSLRYLTEPAMQKPACRSLRELLGRLRRKAQHGSRALTALMTVVIVTNLALCLAALLGGPAWVVVLILRYAVGIVLAAAMVVQYGPLNLFPLIWLIEPLMTVMGAVTYVSLRIAPQWRWGGLLYGRVGRETAKSDR